MSSSSSPTDAVMQSIRDRELTYLLSGARLKVKQNIPKLDIGSVHLEGMNQGDFVDVPRWIAEVLTNAGLCEAQEESFSSEVFRAVNREKIAGDNQLAQLRPDFYLKVRRHLSYSTELVSAKPSTAGELDRTKTLIYDLIALRVRKILLLASSLSPPPDVNDKLTPEELQVFESVHQLLSSWRSIILDGS